MNSPIFPFSSFCWWWLGSALSLGIGFLQARFSGPGNFSFYPSCSFLLLAFLQIGFYEELSYVFRPETF